MDTMLTRKANTNLSVQTFYELTGSFGYIELEVSATAEDDLYIDGWIGAALRNNLLYAAESIQVVGAVSLRQITNILTIKQGHPLYDEMKGGFPRGFGIVVHSHKENLSYCQLKKDEEFNFSILLFGHNAGYYIHFTNAVKQMCERGIGQSMTPLQIINITAKPLVALSDFINKKYNKNDRLITIQYTVPTNLFSTSKRLPVNYTDRQHEFPGFSQLVRTAAHRVARLSLLYTRPDDVDYYRQLEEAVDCFTQYAVTVILKSAQLVRVEFQSTPKKEKPDRIRFSGYIGEVSFEGNFNYYLPLLLFTQPVGVGGNTTYGLGKYKIVKH